MPYIIEESVPDAQEFCDLRLKAGMAAKSIQAATIGLSNTLYAVTIRDNHNHHHQDESDSLDKKHNRGTLIAMGRVIGDGGCNFQIVDVAVDPDFQGRGLGREIMRHIEGYLQSAVLEGSFVSLIADEPAFYQKLGYQLVSPTSEGMFKRFPPVR